MSVPLTRTVTQGTTGADRQSSSQVDTCVQGKKCASPGLLRWASQVTEQAKRCHVTDPRRLCKEENRDTLLACWWFKLTQQVYRAKTGRARNGPGISQQLLSRQGLVKFVKLRSLCRLQALDNLSL